MRVAHKVTQPPDDSVADKPGDEHAALLRKVAHDRDREAFRALFVHFGPRIKAMMLKAGAGHAEAEDLVQDVMLAVWRKAEMYISGRGAVSTWIFTIARNARIDRLRRKSSRAYDDIDNLDIVSQEADGEANALAGQRAKRVSDALTKLPGEQRQIMELAFIHDMPQSAIAKQLKLPLGTVKSRMRLAYVKLTASLEDLR